jgi:PAS domain S-box-containing protein
MVRGFHTERLRKDGAIVPVSITVSPVIGGDGSVIGASTIAHDLSKYVEYVKFLGESERRVAEVLSTLETLQASAPVGIGFVDRELRIVHMNEMLAVVNGSSVKDQIGKTVAEVVPEIWPLVEGIYRHVLEDGEAVLNIDVSGETAAEPGRIHHWLASYYPVHLGTDVIGVGLVLLDITERRQAEEFRSIVMNQMVEGLLTVDMQGRLTSMNDAAAKMLGWSEEELLGEEMRNFVLVKEEDEVSVEEGNLELLKVRSEGRPVRLANHAYRCKDGSILPIAISASPLFIGASVEGAVVVFRDITDEKSEQLRVSRELAALTWVGRIREALDEDRFVLYAQPIVPLTGGQPSEELLLRMVGRNGDVIAPGAFLGVAEKYGLITEIDRWVVGQAVRRAAHGRHVGANLSAESVVSPDLLGFVEQEIDQTGIDPSKLVFEITETALMRDIGKGEAFARGVVDLGCGLALDDFGTGFGTFTHVKKLPITYLKIDIEFVRELVSSSANQHVVKAIVNLAQGFGCQTIAEGVEDAETLKLLEDFGVDFAQGFHLGRPAPFESCAALPSTSL